MHAEVTDPSRVMQSLLYQFGSMATADADTLLAGQTAQLKAHSGIVLESVVGAAIQLLGGTGLTRGGRGERVERVWRDVKAITVPGGSQDVLLEWSVRRALLAQKALWKDGSPGVSKL
jgi:alkylation response protein AidB-like acyl-CoA dehydrogenase